MSNITESNRRNNLLWFHVCDDEKCLCTEKIILLWIPISTVNVHPYHYHVGSRSFDFTLSSPHLGFALQKPSRNDSAKVPPNPTTRGADVWDEVGRGLRMLIWVVLESRFGEVFFEGEGRKCWSFEMIHVYNCVTHDWILWNKFFQWRTAERIFQTPTKPKKETHGETCNSVGSRDQQKWN